MIAKIIAIAAKAQNKLLSSSLENIVTFSVVGSPSINKTSLMCLAKRKRLTSLNLLRLEKYSLLLPSIGNKRLPLNSLKLTKMDCRKSTSKLYKKALWHSPVVTSICLPPKLISDSSDSAKTHQLFMSKFKLSISTRYLLFKSFMLLPICLCMSR